MSEALIESSERKGYRYRALNGHWDEAVLPSGAPRRHWRRLFVEVGRTGARELERSWQAGRNLIQTQGITYNTGSLHDHGEQPWPMDPIPMVISQEEWGMIANAVVQRAHVLNEILRDLYGDQRLLADGLVPPALVLGNPNFLRPCFGVTPPGGIYLHTYAADLGRSPDGQWWVIGDRTQAPSGMGYTLQNRLVSARTFPGAFNQCRVRELTRFFDVKRDALLALAASQRSNPTIVVLTAGPNNETYFEHSFLAAQWGFTLVEGADLTVRDQRVYLKTLGGLKQVDLILRRLDDAFCDPLELRGDSLLGVPGLVHVVRNGNVIIDNALGSGLVESSAHLGFLPGLCQAILGEELALPSVASWWCGQQSALDYVLEHLDELVIKPAHPRFGENAEFPSLMSSAQRAKLAERIQARPHEFVAQEQVALSTAPVRTETKFVPRHAMLRVFAAWDGQSYIVMPGGLTRVSTQKSSLVVSMKLGGGSKDTWVLGKWADLPVRRASLPGDGQSGGADLPSRVADNLFWLGRYAERVEARVRFVRALLPALSGEEDFGRGVSIETAIRLLAGMRYLQEPPSPTASIGEQRWLLQRLLTDIIYDPSQTLSLRWNLKEMRRVARHLKERLSLDTWRVLQELENQFLRYTPSNVDQRYLASMDLLDSTVSTLSAFSGLLMENTTRGYGWRFLEIGRRLERALQSSELLGSSLSAAPADIEPLLQVLLEVADSSITYRQRHPTILETSLVLKLLLADESNPRAIAFQLASLLHQITRLQETDESSVTAVERPLATRGLTSVRNASMTQLSKRDDSGQFIFLEGLLDEVKTTLWDISDALTAHYLSHLTPSRLTSPW